MEALNRPMTANKLRESLHITLETEDKVRDDTISIHGILRHSNPTKVLPFRMALAHRKKPNNPSPQSDYEPVQDSGNDSLFLTTWITIWHH